MVNTRRRSARLNQQDDTQSIASASQSQAEHEPSIAEPEDERPPAPAPAPTNMSVTIPAETLASLAPLFPGMDLATPNEALVLACYQRILSAEQWRARADRLDVEFEMTVADKDRDIVELEKQRDALHERADKAEQVAADAVREKEELVQQVEELRTVSTSSSSTVDALKRRVDELESERRKFLDMVDRHSQDEKQLQEEVDHLRTKLRETRQEASNLEADLSDSRASETTQHFRIQTLEQQLELSQNESQRWADELKSANEAAAAFRREQHSEHARLSNELSALQSSHNQTLSQLTTLRTSHDQLKTTHHNTLETLATLRADYATLQTGARTSSENWNRLRERMEERSQLEHARVEEVEREWEAAQQQYERSRADSEARVAQLEGQLGEAQHRIEELGAALEIGSGGGGSGGLADDPFATLSESALRASMVQRGGRSFSQVYADLVRTDNELRKVRQEYEISQHALDNVLTTLADKAPEIQRKKEAYFKMETQLAIMGTQLTEARGKHQAAERCCSELTTRANDAEKAAADYAGQLADLGRQVRALLRDAAIRDDPLFAGLPDPEEQPGFPGDNPLAPVTTDNVIDSVVLYSNLRELQERNIMLLKMVRALGRRAEEAEMGWRNEENNAVREAEDLVRELTAEVERVRGVAEAARGEAERWKVVAQRQGAPEAQVQLLQPQAQPQPQTTAQDAEELERRREEERAWEEARRSMESELGVLRSENGKWVREAGDLGAKLAVANSQVEFANNRLQLAQQELQHAKSEVDALGRRNAELQQQVARMELTASNNMDELFGMKRDLERVRTEAANAKAERELMKSVERRMTDENAQINKERARLSDLVRSWQTMQAEIERSSISDKARLEQATRDLSALRERLETAERERRWLEGRVEEMGRERERAGEREREWSERVRGLEERVRDGEERVRGKEAELRAAAAARVAPAAAAPAAGGGEGEEGEGGDDDLDQLRAALKDAQAELAAAQEQVEQYRAIAQSSEDALAEYTTSADAYRLSTNDELAKKDSDIQALRRDVAAAQEGLASARAEVERLSREAEEKRVSWEAERSNLQGDVAAAAEAEARLEGEKDALREDLKRVQLRAEAASEKYNTELISHAEARTRMRELSEKVHELERQLATAQNKVVIAEGALASSRASWEQQKEGMEKELAESTSRYKELVKQNDTLHHHLEAAQTTVGRIRQSAESSAAAAEAGGADADPGMTELRSVITYLRREKDIASLQLDMQKQDLIRLRTQYDHQTRELDEARAQLAEERQRAAEVVASAAQHTDLMNKMNEANVFRESNIVLRHDKDRAQKRAEEAERRVKALTEELEPLRQKAAEAQAALETRQAQVKTLEEDVTRWQERCAQALKKNDAIDPEVHQALEEEKDDLEKELVEVKRDLTEMRRTLADTRAELTSTQQAKERAVAGALGWQKHGQEAFEQSKAKIQEHQREVTIVTAERDQLQRRFDETTSAAAASAERVNELEAQVAGLIRERDGRPVVDAGETEMLRGRLASAQAEVDTLRARVAELEPLVARMNELQADVQRLTQENERLVAENGRFADEKQALSAATASETSAEDLKKMTDERNALQTRVEDLMKKSEQYYKQAINHKSESGKKARELAEAEEKLAALEARLAAAPPAGSNVNGNVDARLAEVAVGHEKAMQDARAEMDKLRADLAEARVQLVGVVPRAEMDKLRADLAEAEAKLVGVVPRAELTRLNAVHAGEIRGLKASHAKALEDGIQNERAHGAPGGVANVDAIVTARLDAAVREAIERHDTEVQQKQSQAVAEAKANTRKEGDMRHMLLQQSLTRVKGTLERANARIKQLEEAMEAYGVEIPPAPEPPAPVKEERAEPTSPATTASASLAAAPPAAAPASAAAFAPGPAAVPAPAPSPVPAPFAAPSALPTLIRPAPSMASPATTSNGSPIAGLPNRPQAVENHPPPTGPANRGTAPRGGVVRGGRGRGAGGTRGGHTNPLAASALNAIASNDAAVPTGSKRTRGSEEIQIAGQAQPKRPRGAGPVHIERPTTRGNPGPGAAM